MVYGCFLLNERGRFARREPTIYIIGVGIYYIGIASSLFEGIPPYPTLPSSDTLRSLVASTANSIGSLLITSLA